MLNKKQRLFCREYASGKSRKEAYKAAYKVANDVSAQTSADKLLKRDDVQAELRELAKKIEDETIMNIKEAQQRLTSYARQEMTEDVVIGGGAIVRRKVGAKIALQAIELLCKIRGDFAPDKQQVDVSGGVPIVLVDDVKDDDDA